jgi:hypothetical protein
MDNKINPGYLTLYFVDRVQNRQYEHLTKLSLEFIDDCDEKTLGSIIKTQLQKLKIKIDAHENS